MMSRNLWQSAPQQVRWVEKPASWRIEDSDCHGQERLCQTKHFSPVIIVPVRSLTTTLAGVSGSTSISSVARPVQPANCQRMVQLKNDACAVDCTGACIAKEFVNRRLDARYVVNQVREAQYEFILRRKNKTNSRSITAPWCGLSGCFCVSSHRISKTTDDTGPCATA